MPKLSEYIYIKHGYPFKGEYISSEDNGVVLVTPGNFEIGGGFKEKKCKFFHGNYPREFILDPGDLIITMTDLSKDGDTLGYSAIVPTSDRIYLHNQRIGLVKFINDGLDKNYLHWFMRTKKYQKSILASCSGTTVKHTSPSRIMETEISLPDMAVQREIADFLDALENKIVLNMRINDNLMQQARAIFKEWFVDFIPFGEVRPTTWKLSNIYKLSDIIYGAPFKSKLFNTEGNGTPVVRIRDLKSGVLNTYTTELHPKGYLLQAGDIVVGMDGEFRPYIWARGPALLNQRVCVFANKRSQGKFFLYFTIEPLLYEIELTEQATTVIHIGKHDFDRFEFYCPDDKTMDQFDALTMPMYQAIVKNQEESIRLAKLRDTLLPRLMSGELDVSGLDL